MDYQACIQEGVVFQHGRNILVQVPVGAEDLSIGFKDDLYAIIFAGLGDLLFVNQVTLIKECFFPFALAERPDTEIAGEGINCF